MLTLKKKVYAFCINDFVLQIWRETLAGYSVSHGKALIPQAMAVLSILYMNNSPFSWSLAAWLHYQMSHLQKPKRAKAGALLQCTVLKDFKKLLEQDKLHKILVKEARPAAAQQLREALS